jgi:Phage tail assembly chaperone protein
MNLLADHENEAPDEWLVERMRNERNALLVECDWRVLPDVPNPSAWIVYRQSLRDFPATWTPAATVEFPQKP